MRCVWTTVCALLILGVVLGLPIGYCQEYDISEGVILAAPIASAEKIAAPDLSRLSAKAVSGFEDRLIELINDTRQTHAELNGDLGAEQRPW